MPRDDEASEFRLPAGLTRLLATGDWPTTDGPSMTEQELDPLFSADRVRRFAAEQSVVCLQPPPFPTIAQEQAARGAGDFWKQFGALDQIVPEKALVIGDFGMGSDSPIILDYARNAANPPVLYLRLRPDRHNEWVQGARDFDEFAQMLGLTEGAAKVPCKSCGQEILAVTAQRHQGLCHQCRPISFKARKKRSWILVAIFMAIGATILALVKWWLY